MGGGYGYSLIANHFFGNKFSDLVVGVPYYTDTNDRKPNKGCVMYYINDLKKSFLEEKFINGSGGSFGMALSNIGDINGDTVQGKQKTNEI